MPFPIFIGRNEHLVYSVPREGEIIQLDGDNWIVVQVSHRKNTEGVFIACIHARPY